MKKVFYITVTFFVCRLLDIADIWMGFTAVTLLFFSDTDKNLMWEIPLGVLACSVALDFLADDITTFLRITIPLATLFTAWLYPKRIWVVFGVAIVSLALKNIYTASALWAFLWYSFRPARFLFKYPCIDYSSTKR